MDTRYERNLGRFCRTCMHDVTKATATTSEPKRHWQFISDTVTEFGKWSIAELLSKTMPQIKVDLNDERMPTKICDECLLQLRNSYRFQMICLRTDQQLHELLAKIHCDIIEKKEISEIIFPMQEIPLKTIDRAKMADAADPLESTIDDIVVGQTAAGAGNTDEFIKDERCGDDERGIEYDSDREIFHSAIDIKDEIFEAEPTDEEKSNESLIPNTHTKNSAEQNEIVAQAKKSGEKYRFKCDLCNRYFNKAESFDKHRLAHMEGVKEGLDIYSCEMCGKTYSTRAILKRHEKEVHLRTKKRKQNRSKQYKCIYREKILESSNMSPEHMLTHTAEQENFFGTHTKNSVKQNEIIQVEKESTEDEDISVDRLLPNTHTNNSVEQNEIVAQAKESGDQQYRFKCDLCNRYFNKAESFDKHRLAHLEGVEGIDIYSCEMCGKTYSTRPILKRHEKEVHLRTRKRKQNRSKQYKCTFRKKILEGSKMSPDHMRTHTAEQETLFHDKHTQNSVEQNEIIDEGKESIEDEDNSIESLLPNTHTENSAELNASLNEDNSIESLLPNTHTENSAELNAVLNEDNSIESLLPNTHTENSAELSAIMEQANKSGDQQYRLKCDLCNRYFNKAESFDKHRLAHMEGVKEGLDIYSCEMCGKTYSTRPILKRHEKEVHLRTRKRKRSKQCKCIFCEKILESSMLQDHMRTHTDEQETSLHTKYSAEQNEIMEQEKESSDQQYSFKCDLCNRYFYKAESLHKHRLAHVEEDKQGLDIHSCELCGKIFNTPGTLKRHEKEVHLLTQPRKIKQYKCKFCEKSLKNSMMFKDHMRTHTDVHQYLCSECGKVFKSKRQLNDHIERHINTKLIECPYCPKTFNCKNDLCAHKAIHKGVKRHVCDICGKSFIKRNQLKVHKTYHTDEKPYKCDYCEMRFHRMDNQRTHMRKHTGEKPYKCKYCERAFSQSGDHVKHLRSHLGENVYWCELCPATFRLMSELRLHFATHKNEDPETRERNLKALKEAEAELQLKLMNKAESR